VYGKLKVIYLVALRLCRFSLGINAVSRVRRRRLLSGHGLAASIGGNGGEVERTAAAECVLGQKLERIAVRRLSLQGGLVSCRPAKASSPAAD